MKPENKKYPRAARALVFAVLPLAVTIACGSSSDPVSSGDGDGDGDGDMGLTTSGGTGSGGNSDVMGGATNTGGTAETGGTGTGGEGSTHPEIDMSYCTTPGWENALAHAENIAVTATFVDGEKEVLAEYDIASVSMEDLEAEYPLVVTVSTEVGADYVVDGVDDHVEINQATDQVYQAGGGLVYLEAGIYTVSDSVYVWDNTTFKGAGRVGERRTVIFLAANAPTMSGQAGIVRVKKDYEKGSLKRVANATVEDFVIDGNRENQAVIPYSEPGVVPVTRPDEEKKYGFYAEGDNILAQRVTVQNCMGYGFDPHQHEDVLDSTVSILDSYSYGNLNDGFTLDAIYDVVVAHNVSWNNDRHGFNIVTGTENITICGNVSYENGLPPEGEEKGKGSGIQAQNGSDPETPIPNTLTVMNNSVWGNGKSGIDFRMTFDSVVEGNYVTGNGEYGLRLRGADNNEVTGNTIERNSVISGSAYEVVLGDYDDTVNPLHGSDNNVITENTIRNIGGRFVREEPTGTGNTVDDNTLEL